MKRDERVARSVLKNVMLKVQKKHLTVAANENLFDYKKLHTLKFEYHEAHFLEQYLLICEANLPLNDYDHNAVLLFKNKLNQQLA